MIGGHRTLERRADRDLIALARRLIGVGQVVLERCNIDGKGGIGAPLHGFGIEPEKIMRRGQSTVQTVQQLACAWASLESGQKRKARRWRGWGASRWSTR